MNAIVLDASVVLKWFRTEDEGYAAADALKRAYASGVYVVAAPRLLLLEMLNVAGRGWRWQRSQLMDLVERYRRLEFDAVEPDAASVVGWIAEGLTAYDAVYVALAEELEAPLITSDRRLKRAAPHLATLLEDWPPEG